MTACQPPSLNTNPATWSNSRLAAQLIIAGSLMARVKDDWRWVDAGIGGIVLMGDPPKDLGSQLALLRATGPVPPLIACDVEGGASFIAPLIGSVPTESQLGAHYTPAQIKYIFYVMGLRMKALGVDVDFAPVADLLSPGHYIASLQRAFSSNPQIAAADAVAWEQGMRLAGVLPVVKHWPGHGEAANTHVGPGITPPLSVMEARDMVPFNAVFASGGRAVMVGHLTVPGLTNGLPATLSPAAYRYLRARIGPQGLILTDLMEMAAVTTSMHLDDVTAAVRALESSADVVLALTDPYVLKDAITRAIDSGQYPRANAVASAQRMLAAKRILQ